MSRRADLARLERLDSYINDVFSIVDRHGERFLARTQNHDPQHPGCEGRLTHTTIVQGVV